MFFLEEYLVHKSHHNPSYLSPPQNFRKYILKQSEPLKKIHKQ